MGYKKGGGLKPEEENGVGATLRDALLFTTMCIIGLPVDVYIKDGAVYSGIFHTACVDDDYAIVLKRAKMIKKGSREANVARGNLIETLVILSEDLVQVVAKGVVLSADSIPGHVDGNNIGTVCSNITYPEYNKKEMEATKSKVSTVDGDKASKERHVRDGLINKQSDRRESHESLRERTILEVQGSSSNWFIEPSADDTVEGNSLGLKLVPWISWDEWNSIRDSLFSSSPSSVAFALQRISTWRSRGCIPIAVDVTASIVEIQQKDPFFRKDLGGNALQSEEMLSMLYCMAIMRLVNGVVEKTRKKAEISIAEAANAIGIPRMLIDVRHEGSHRDLPSLQLVCLASTKALDWLKSYYWEPQKNAIRRDSTANLRKEIKHKLLEMAFCLKVKQTNSSHTSEKRIRLGQLCARNKFLPFISGKLPNSKTAGSKKQITRAMKAILRLYTSSSSEVASVLLELMLQTVDSSNLPGDSENALTIHESIDMHSAYDDWKPILKKLSNREPDLLLTLLRAALDMIETMEATKHELGATALSRNANESLLIGQLSYLCEQIVANLKTLNPLNHNDLAADGEDSSRKLSLPEATLQELLRKCLFLSSYDNNQLMKSALVIAQMIGRNSFIQKLNKLCSLSVFYSEIIHSDPSTNSSESFLLSREEDSLHQAAQKLELIMRRVANGNNMNTIDTGGSQWVVAKTWKACPIGMLPHAFGSTGCLPVLDFVDDSALVAKSSHNEIPDTNKCGCKRQAECLDDPNMKKIRKIEGPGDSQCTENVEIENGHNDAPFEGSTGHLMICGVWKKVSKEELRDIAAAVKIWF